MGVVISIREAYRVRYRRRTSALNARCRDLIADSIAAWRVAEADATPADRAVCLQRIRVLGELLAAADRVS